VRCGRGRNRTCDQGVALGRDVRPRFGRSIRGPCLGKRAVVVITVRMRGHQPTRDYAKRRTAEGLTRREIIRCPSATSLARSTQGRIAQHHELVTQRRGRPGHQAPQRAEGVGAHLTGGPHLWGDPPSPTSLLRTGSGRHRPQRVGIGATSTTNDSTSPSRSSYSSSARSRPARPDTGAGNAAQAEHSHIPRSMVPSVNGKSRRRRPWMCCAPSPQQVRPDHKPFELRARDVDSGRESRAARSLRSISSPTRADERENATTSCIQQGVVASSS